MTNRPFVCVSGPGGAGKTTLREHLLTVTAQLLIVARCETDKRLRRAQEPIYDNDEELDRYRAAGASSAVRYRLHWRNMDEWTLEARRISLVTARNPGL